MAKRMSQEAQHGQDFASMMRAYDHLKRAEVMYGLSFQRQWYAEVFTARHAAVFPPRERPEFPSYVGTDGREHAEF